MDTLIQQGLIYYDKKNEKYNNVIQLIDHSKTKIIDIEDDTKTCKRKFYDSSGKLIMEADYEIAGIYLKKDKIWIWSWCLPYNTKNKSRLSRKILNYGLDIVIDTHNIKKVSSEWYQSYLSSQYFLKTELITSRIKVTDNIYKLDITSLLCSILKTLKKLSLNINNTITKKLAIIKANNIFLFIYLFK